MIIELKKAEEKDLPKIVDIYNQSIPSRMATADTKPVSVDDRIDWFHNFDDHFPIWIIQSDSNVVGWISLSEFYGRPAYHLTAEISIYLDSNHAHHGLGQKALRYAEKKASDLHIKNLLAFVFGHNIPSQKLFKKNDYTIWGHFPKIAELDGNLRDLDILGKKL